MVVSILPHAEFGPNDHRGDERNTMYMFMRKDTKRNITVVKPVPMIRLLIPNCGADNAGTKFIFFLLSSIAIQFIVRIKLSGISDPSVTGVETSLNAG